MNKLSVIWLCSLLLFSGCFVHSCGVNYAITGIVPEIDAYIVHPPLRINSNADLASQATAESWHGNGTVWAPFIIENYEINGSGLGDCIYIGNVTSHFSIQNCSLHDANSTVITLYQLNSGIHLYRAGNGTLKNNTVYSNSLDGIHMRECLNATLINNNNISDNNDDGIRIIHSNYTIVENNTVTYNLENGIEPYGMYPWFRVHDNVMRNNTCMYNKRGIFLRDSVECILESNILENNSIEGLRVYSSDDNLIRNNTLINNEYGLWLYDSSGNEIYHNDVIGNINNSCSESSYNQFDNGYPSGGNYWSDYTGLDGYSGVQTYVSGDGTKQRLPNSDGFGDTDNEECGYSYDNYPFMHPIHRSWADNLTPVSSVLQINPYWHTTQTTLLINATAGDRGGLGMRDVTLWYRSSADNLSWSAWTVFSTDFICPWSWTFTFPGTQRYYEFHSNTSDLAGIQENLKIIPEARYGLDDSKPLSSIDPLTEYFTDYGVIINCTANDTFSGVSSVALWYRFSANNYSWGNWTLYSTDTVFPYTWSISPLIDGAYEFYTLASDVSGNIEDTPGAAECTCALDIYGPWVGLWYNPLTGTTGESITLQANITDDFIVSSVVISYRFYTLQNNYTNASLTSSTNNFRMTLQIPSNGAGDLEYYFTAWDGAGNVDVDGRGVNILDNDAPTANAGQHMTIIEGTTFNFNGTDSFDNMGIINYTWTIGNLVFYEKSFSYNFTNVMNYTVKLTVFDSMGNNDTDIVFVNIIPYPNSDNDGIPDYLDDDSDNDGTPDLEDDFPLDSDETTDSDADGIGDNADTDDDNDYVEDIEDAFPMNPDETTDTDGDGIGNNLDSDDDGDGVPDIDDFEPLNPDVTTNPNTAEGPNWYLWIGVIVIIVITLTIVFLIRKKHPPTAENKDLGVHSKE